MLGWRVRVIAERRDDVVDRLVPLVVGVVDAGRGRGVDDPRVQLAQVPVVDRAASGSRRCRRPGRGCWPRPSAGRRRCRASCHRGCRDGPRWRARRRTRVSRIRCLVGGTPRRRSPIGLSGALSSTGVGAGPEHPDARRCRSRKRWSFGGSDVSTSTAICVDLRARARRTAPPRESTPSAAAAAARHDAGCMQVAERRACAPRACTFAAPSLLRTSAST